MKRFILAVVIALGLAVTASRALAQHGGVHTDASGQHGQTVEQSAAGVEGGHGPTGEHAGTGEHEATHNKPPLIPDPTSRETIMSALWVVIIFVLLLAILYPTAWKNVLAGLKAREERIRKDIADAEQARANAEATLRDYTTRLNAAEQQIRDMMAKATADGERIASQIRMHAQQEAEEIKERANRDIETARDQAIREVYEQTATLATSVAEKILRRNLNADDQRELVRSSLDQLQNVNRG